MRGNNFQKNTLSLKGSQGKIDTNFWPIFLLFVWNVEYWGQNLKSRVQEEIDTRIDCVRQIKFHLSQIILGTFFRPDGIDGWPIGQGK